MVAIKTTPSVRNKKTDIEKTLKALTTTLNALNDKLHEDKQTEIKRQKELEIQHKKDLKELKESFKNIIPGETKRNIGSTLIGGALGWSPAVVKAMGLDRLGTAIVKSTVSGIKKQLNGLFRSSEDKDIAKATSAIEANKNAPLVKHLVEIKGLLKNNKKQTTVVQDEEKKQTGLLGVLGGIFNSGVLKLITGLALLAGIARGVFWIARKFGWNPSTTIKNIPGPLGGLGMGLQYAGESINTKQLNEKAYRDALTELEKDPYYKKLSPEERAKQIKEPNNSAPNSFKEKVEKVNETRATLYDTHGISKKEIKKADIRAANSAKNIAEKGAFTKSYENAKYNIRRTGPKATAKTGNALTKLAIGLDLAATGAEIVNDIQTGNEEKAIPDLIKGLSTIDGMLLGGAGGAELCSVGGPYASAACGLVGGLLGAWGSESAVKAAYPKLYRNLAEESPQLIPKPKSEPFTPDGMASFGEEEFATAMKYLWPGFYYDWIKGKGTYHYGYQYANSEWAPYIYAQGLLGNPMPTEITNGPAYGGDMFTAKQMAQYRDIYEEGLANGKKRNDLQTAVLSTEGITSDPELHEINNNLKNIQNDIQTQIEILKQSIKDDEARDKRIKEQYREFFPSNNNSFENPNANMNTPGKSDFEMIYARGAM